MFATTSAPYDESKCRYVWSDAVVFSEFPTLQWCSHYWMEFLSNLFFVVASRESESRPGEHLALRKKPVFIIRRKFYDRSSPNLKRDFSNLPPYHAGIWPMLSDHEWMEWDDILGVLANGVGGPSQLCFRRLHVLQDFNMTMPRSPEMAPYWRMYRQSMWTHLRVHLQHGVPAEILSVLFLRRPSSRRLLNHDEIAAMLQMGGFEVRSITPDRNSLSVVASAVVQVSILIGINSGAYNAVFLRTGCAVLELAPHLGELYLPGGTRLWQVGFVWLGVHQYTYACPSLYTSGMREVFSDSTTDVTTSGIQSPIVVSPRTILTILDELVEVLVQARESGSEEVNGGGPTVRPCLPWERNHSQSWTRNSLRGAPDFSVTRDDKLSWIGDGADLVSTGVSLPPEPPHA